MHDWGFRRLSEDDHLATVKIEGRVEQTLAPLAPAVVPRTEVHERTQISANAGQRTWTHKNDTETCEPQGQHGDWLFDPET